MPEILVCRILNAYVVFWGPKTTEPYRKALYNDMDAEDLEHGSRGSFGSPVLGGFITGALLFRDFC